MRFRVRLALLFLLLSAFPLTLLALYSFTTSSRALRQAAEAEARLMARELEQRVEGVSSEIDRSVKALARLPATYWLQPDAGSASNGEGRLDAQVFAGLAQALPFIEDLRFVPRTDDGRRDAQASAAARGARRREGPHGDSDPPAGRPVPGRPRADPGSARAGARRDRTEPRRTA